METTTCLQLGAIGIGALVLVGYAIAVKAPRSAAWMRILLGVSGVAALGYVGYSLSTGDTSHLNPGLIAAPFFILFGGTQVIRRKSDEGAPSS